MGDGGADVFLCLDGTGQSRVNVEVMRWRIILWLNCSCECVVVVVVIIVGVCQVASVCLVRDQDETDRQRLYTTSPGRRHKVPSQGRFAADILTFSLLP